MARYEHARGKDYCLFDTVMIAESQDYDRIKESLLTIREKVAQVYGELLEEKEAGVLNAMILGDRSSLPREIKGLYQRSGVAHALSISGVKTFCSTYPFFLKPLFYGGSRHYISNSYIPKRRFFLLC